MRPCIEKICKPLRTGTFSTRLPMRKKGRRLNKGTSTIKKILLLVMLLTICVTSAFSQVNTQGRPVLAILPFYGVGEMYGDNIASFLSVERPLLEVFTVRASTRTQLELLSLEHDFQLQMEYLIDLDTRARIGHLLRANYVLFGNVRRLGSINLVIATIVNAATFEQVAGYYRVYQTVGEINGFLPSMAQYMTQQWRERGRAERDTLAITPFAHHSGVNPDDAYTLSQILAIEIIRTGGFAVLSRTSALQAVGAEWDFQMGDDSITEDEGILRAGYVAGARYALYSSIRILDGRSFFSVAIIHVEGGSVTLGHRMEQQNIADGMGMMAEFAFHLYPVGGYVLQGDRYLDRGEFYQAISAFQAALHIRPNHSRAMEGLTLARARYASAVLAQIAAEEIAVAAAQREREETERRAQAEEVITNIANGDRNMLEGQFSLAIVAYEAALQIAPEHAQATERLEIARKVEGYIDTGNAYLERNRFGRADRAFRNALEILPNHPSITGRLQAAKDAWHSSAWPRFWSMGLSIGTAFAEPWAITTVQVTLAPFRYSFIRIGGDYGFVSGVGGVGYSFISPFAHYAFFVPFGGWGGWYIGVGGGVIWERYQFEDIDLIIARDRIPAMDFTTGFIIGNRIDISYTLRTTDFSADFPFMGFSSLIHKLSIGFTQRFFQPTRRQN